MIWPLPSTASKEVYAAVPPSGVKGEDIDRTTANIGFDLIAEQIVFRIASSQGSSRDVLEGVHSGQVAPIRLCRVEARIVIRRVRFDR